MSSTPPSYVGLPTRLKNPNDIFEFFEWQLLCGLRVACPGIIQSFDAVKQTVTVQLSIRENILKNLVPTPTDVPLIIDLPIVLPRAGNCTLTMPVTKGDECLVIFGDNCIDGWWQAGGIQNQLDRRRHDLSDGFALLGVWSQPRVLPNYSPDTAQLRSDDGQSVVEVDPAGVVNIKAPTVNILAADQININSDTNRTLIEGVDFLTHTHSGVQTGAGVSGPVVPTGGEVS